MHLFFDRIEILPKPRPGGQRIAHVRFKFPIPLDGGPVNYDHDIYYDDDDDDPPDGDPPSGGDAVPLEIALSDGGASLARNCVPKPTKVSRKFGKDVPVSCCVIMRCIRQSPRRLNQYKRPTGETSTHARG